MSMYNQIFKTNPIACILLDILGIDQKGGQWHSGRFRDVYVKCGADGIPRIVVHTRNGGGNREHWEKDYADKAGPDCRCPGCCVSHHLPQHPNYICDSDMDFDCTYADIEFSVPNGYLDFVKKAVKHAVYTETPQEKWGRLMAGIKSGDETDPNVKRAAELGKEIVKKIKAGTGGIIEV